MAGLDQKQAGKRVLSWCEERGLLDCREPYRHTIAVCERCESRIEPLISLQWWCRMDEPGPRRSRLCKPAACATTLESQHRFAIDSLATCARLEHLAPAVVGASAPRLVLPRRSRHRRRVGTGGVRRVRQDRARARPGRPRHVVLVGAVAVRDARLAGRHAGAAPLYPGDLNITAREIIRLWENRMIFAGLELCEQIPFSEVIIHSTVLAPTDGACRSRSATASTRWRSSPSTAPMRRATAS